MNNKPTFLKSVLTKTLQFNDKNIMNGNAKIYGLYAPIMLSARALKRNINDADHINKLWYNYNQARLDNNMSKIIAYAIQLHNLITAHYYHIIDFQKKYEDISIDDDSRKDTWVAWAIGTLKSDD